MIFPYTPKNVSNYINSIISIRLRVALQNIANRSAKYPLHHQYVHYRAPTTISSKPRLCNCIPSIYKVAQTIIIHRRLRVRNYIQNITQNSCAEQSRLEKKEGVSLTNSMSRYMEKQEESH